MSLAQTIPMIGSRGEVYYDKSFAEQILWDSFRLGSKSTFDQMFELCIRRLQSFDYAMCKDGKPVDDSVQTLFLELYDAPAKVTITNIIKYYLLKSVRRLINRSIKTKRCNYSLIPLSESGLNEFSLLYESKFIELQTENARREVFQRFYVLLHGKAI